MIASAAIGMSRAPVFWGGLTLVLGLMLAGCAGGITAAPPGLDWSAFLTGGDIAANCREGTPNRLRLVYTLKGGGFRVLELEDSESPAGNPTGPDTERAADVTRWTVTADDMGRTGPDEAWRKTGERIRLRPPEVEAVFATLDAAGAFLPPDPRDLPAPGSRGFLVAACSGGESMATVRFQPQPGGVPIGFRE